MRLPVLEWSLRLWRSTPVIFGLLLVAAWVIGNSHFEHLEETSPRVPNPATGEVVPMHWKSVVVYMTQSDAQLDRWFEGVGFAVWLVLMAFAFWQNRRRLFPK